MSNPIIADGGKYALEPLEFDAGQNSATIVIELLDEDKVVQPDGAPAFTVSLCDPVKPAKIGKIGTCSPKAISGAGPGTLVLAEDEI